MKKVKDTKLGDWLKEKAPNVLAQVGHLLPNSGVLSIVKNLLANSNKKDDDYYRSMLEAENIAQNSVTDRWKADMSSGNRLSQMIRPITLIVLLSLYLALVVVDSISNIQFEVREEYISLLEVLSMTAFGSYFAGRSYEKTKL